MGVLFVDDDNLTTIYRSKDLVIAVMGVTGVGKSTFISYFSQTARVGDSLESCKSHESNGFI